MEIKWKGESSHVVFLVWTAKYRLGLAPFDIAR